MEHLEACLQKYINSTDDPYIMFETGCAFFEMKQYASAFSFFLMCADKCKDDKIVAECLLICSKIMDIQGRRSQKEYDLILHALSVGLEFPEVHYIKSLYHSWRNEWTECYTSTCLALSVVKDFTPTFKHTDLFGYNGECDLIYQKILSAFKRGKYVEAKDLSVKYNISCDLIPENIQPSISIRIKRPDVMIFNNFYNDPDSIREHALNLKYESEDKHGAVGWRCESGRRIIEGTKEFFEKVLECKIPEGTNNGEWGYSTNGCFQWCNKDIRRVWHRDSQEYAGIIYLTPDAPPNCGTSFWRHRKYKSMDGNSVFSKDDWKDLCTEDDPHIDPKPWEEVDRAGNVYNRLVIFKATQVHAVTEYFGNDINDSRLFQLFFFNICAI